MTYEEHIAAARTFLFAEALLSDPFGMGMAAAEVVWGATIQVVDATNHQSIARHVSSNRNREYVIEYLENKYSFDDLSRGFKSVVNHLHNHFYTGRLSNLELSLHLATGINFVNRMMELAGHEGPRS